MHEFGYVESLLPVLEKRADGRSVTRLGVRAGVLHRLVDDSFQQAFDTVAAGTVADGARVELEQVPVEVSCTDCGATSDATQQESTCPSCGSTAITNTSGDEFVLHWVAYADAEEPAPGT